MTKAVFVVCVTVAVTLTANFSVAESRLTKSSVQGRKAIFEGTVEQTHSLVVQVDLEKNPPQWGERGPGRDFKGTVEVSDKVSLGGGRSGHGFVLTAGIGKAKTTTPVVLSGSIAGKMSVRKKDDFVTEDGRVTFADIVLKDGKKLPVSFRIDESDRK